MEEGENGLEIEKKTLLNNLENEKSSVDKLKFEEESQVMAIEKILVKIDTFTFPMKGELTLLVGEEKAKFNLNQPLPLTEKKRNMFTKICSLLPSKGYMFEESPFLIDVLASAVDEGDCFEEIVAEPFVTIKGDYEFLYPL